jgi:hypothetical protein
VKNRFFVGLTGIADDAARYFGLPTDRVVEVGTQVAVSANAHKGKCCLPNTPARAAFAEAESIGSLMVNRSG